MPSAWPALPYAAWSETCDTLHAHTQVLGKLAVALAPPEPQLQHAALRLTARGWETLACPRPTAPARSSSRSTCIPTRRSSSTATGARGGSRSPPTGRSGRSRARCSRRSDARRRDRDRPDPAGGPLDRAARRGRRAHALRSRAGSRLLRRGDPCRARARRVPRAVPRPLDAGQRVVGLVRSRGEPVLRRARRPAVGGLHHAQRDGRPGGRGGLVAGRRTLRQGRLLRLRPPSPDGFADATLSPPPARWDAALGEYVLDWDDVCAAPTRTRCALEFARSVFRHACLVCDWDPALAASAEGSPPPMA